MPRRPDPPPEWLARPGVKVLGLAPGPAAAPAGKAGIPPVAIGDVPPAGLAGAIVSGTMLALDVSSKAAGWAAFGAGRLGSFGVIRPKPSLPSARRIDFIADAIGDVVSAATPAVAVVEWSAGKTHRRIRKASGLAVLGQAQGAARERLRALGVPTWCVAENDWTRSYLKTARAMVVRLAHPDYARWADGGEDRGLDVADAVGLGDWALGRAREAELLAARKETSSS